MFLDRLFNKKKKSPTEKLSYDDPGRKAIVERYTTTIVSGLRGFHDSATIKLNRELIHYTINAIYEEAFNGGMDIGYQLKESELIQQEDDQTDL